MLVRDPCALGKGQLIEFSLQFRLLAQITRDALSVLGHSLSMVEWSHLLSTETSTRCSSRLSSTQASALLADLCLLFAVAVR